MNFFNAETFSCNFAHEKENKADINGYWKRVIMIQCNIQLVLWVSQARVWAPNWIMMAVTLPRAGRENRNPPSHQEVSSCRHDFDGGLNPYCVDPNLINFENLYSNNHWLRSSKDECSTGGDQTIILGLHIFLDHRSLSSIGQKLLMILPPPPSPSPRFRSK